MSLIKIGQIIKFKYFENQTRLDLGHCNTVWKLQNYSVTKILRENEIGDFLVSKSTILTQLEALNFYFYSFLHFLKAQIDKIESPKNDKKAVLKLLETPKWISCKIWVKENVWNFHTVYKELFDMANYVVRKKRSLRRRLRKKWLKFKNWSTN